jgi:acetoin utilization deacetylase AcuC-like enzyme
MTGIFYDPLFLRHETGVHPECPDRLIWIVAQLEQTGLWQRCLHPRCRDATLEELCLVHDRAYVDHVRALAESGGGALDSETVLSGMSYAAAVRAAGAGLAAVEDVLKGEIRNAFCAVRPPGHHAMPGQGMGFCIFNNVAVAARSLIMRQGLRRVAIFDWDAHHGNGTQHIFYRDGAVFYASLHLWPHWPGTGARTETGEGAGLGTTVNRPIPHGATPESYLAAAREIVAGPMADFRPEFILISAGFDPYREDPLAPMGLAPEHFGKLTGLLADLAAQTCGGRLVSLLEGGYHSVGLPQCAAAHVEGLIAAAGDQSGQA